MLRTAGLVSELVPAISRISLRVPTVDIQTIYDNEYERELVHSSIWLSPCLAAQMESCVKIPKALGTLETMRAELHYLLYIKELLDETLSLDGNLYFIKMKSKKYLILLRINSIFNRYRRGEGTSIDISEVHFDMCCNTFSDLIENAPGEVSCWFFKYRFHCK